MNLQRLFWRLDDISLINDEYLLAFDGILYGLFDVDLNCIFKLMYKDVKFIAKDMIKVRVGTKYVLIDKNKKELSKIRFDFMKIIDDELVLFLENYKFGFMN
ncbi:hypothetical protein IY972_04825 [Campylobacter volucris]|uniref:hypothetical protein n=1 Tax=Campylobacter volucris TaxID=1031542 RepID=UPI00189FBB89|nr:hypothetical protein [Campylobacter volucris]MBF7049353.1 hypothetical protein [Campylobacter volucris]MBF7060229.1 hypothetical protein [Campylobacter volucris]